VEAEMAGCNEVRIDAEFRTLTELDANVQRFAFDEEHSRLRDLVAVHTIEDSQDIQTFQMIHGPGVVRGLIPDDFQGVGARYSQIMAIRQGHLMEFMSALDELATFHERAGIQPVTVWSLRR